MCAGFCSSISSKSGAEKRTHLKKHVHHFSKDRRKKSQKVLETNFVYNFVDPHVASKTSHIREVLETTIFLNCTTMNGDLLIYLLFWKSYLGYPSLAAFSAQTIHYQGQIQKIIIYIAFDPTNINNLHVDYH